MDDGIEILGSLPPRASLKTRRHPKGCGYRNEVRASGLGKIKILSLLLAGFVPVASGFSLKAFRV